MEAREEKEGLASGAVGREVAEKEGGVARMSSGAAPHRRGGTRVGTSRSFYCGLGVSRGHLLVADVFVS